MAVAGTPSRGTRTVQMVACSERTSGEEKIDDSRGPGSARHPVKGRSFGDSTTPMRRHVEGVTRSMLIQTMREGWKLTSESRGGSSTASAQ